MGLLWQVENTTDLYLDKFAHRYSTFPGQICVLTTNCRFWSWAIDDKKCFLKYSASGYRTLKNHWSGERWCPPMPSNFIETQVAEDSTARDDEIDGVDEPVGQDGHGLHHAEL